MPRRVWLAVVVLALGVGLVAAAALAGPEQNNGGTLRISSIFDLPSVDPAIAYFSLSSMTMFATCAKLYSYPDKPAPEGAIPIPEVATGFPKVSPDGKTQTITLKRTYRFNTGARVTAANYLAAFNRDANPKLQSSAVPYLREIEGADAVIDGKAPTISGVKALDRYTLQVRTTRPVHDLVFRLTLSFFCPIAVNTPLKEIDDPLGSGPYYIASRIPNRQTVLERNPFYRGPRTAHVDRIVWSIGLGQAACQQAVEQDEQDWCAQNQQASIRDLVARYGINKPNGRFFLNRKLETNYFAFNHDRPAFKGAGQIPLEQAINWAIDRPALARAAGYLGAQRTDHILPGAMGRDASIYPLGGVTDQSLARARALLAKAKYKPPTLVLAASNCPCSPWAVQAQIFQYDMKRLGIDVQIEYSSFDTYFDTIATRGQPFDVSFGGWATDYPDGAGFLPSLLDSHLTPTDNANTTYFNSPKYNREIKRISGLSGEARLPAWADLDVEMMRNDPPWAPYSNSTELDFVSKSYGCYVYDPVIGRPNLVATCKK